MATCGLKADSLKKTPQGMWDSLWSDLREHSPRSTWLPQRGNFGLLFWMGCWLVSLLKAIEEILVISPWDLCCHELLGICYACFIV